MLTLETAIQKIQQFPHEQRNKVIEYIVPLLLKESKFYFNYLKDSDRTNLPILDRPVMIFKDRKQTLPAFYK